jgi:hypothetical protein
MRNKEDMRIIGILDLVLKDEKGRVKETRKMENLIVNNGKYGIADQLIASPTINKPSHFAVGTGSTAPSATQTALVSETGTRVTFSSKTRSGKVVTMVGTFAAGNGTGALTEAGIFNASSSGSMYSRVTFSVINKGASDSLELTWTYTIG